MAGFEAESRARLHPIFRLYKCLCLAFVLLLFILIVTLMSFYPACSIQNLYFPALNKNLNASTNSLIFFDLELESPYALGIRYNPVELTFYSDANKSTAIGSYTVPGFKQRRKRKAWRRDVVVANGSVPWQEAAIKALSRGEKAVFRVDAAVKVKLKNLFWYSDKKRKVVGGKFEVDDSGRNVGKNAVKLAKSGTAPPLRAGLLVATCFLVYAV